MHPWALDSLACPESGLPLTLRAAVREGDNIIGGELVSASGRVYPIVRSVPRFVSSSDRQERKSVESFGYEWNALNFHRFRLNWLEHIVERNFGSSDYLKGKTVVDCGAGSGMQSRWMLDAGAERVISLELSDSVDDIMKENLKGFDGRSLVVQCDISRPPIRRGAADLVYCLNVIQHTKDPKVTTAALYALLNPGQELYINYYRMSEDWRRQLRTKINDTIRRRFTSRLPNRALMALCRVAALANVVPGLKQTFGFAFLVCGEVPDGPGKFSRTYHQTLLNTYDWYGSHKYQYYFRSSDLLVMFRDLGIPFDCIPNLVDVIANPLAGYAFKFTTSRSDFVTPRAQNARMVN